MDSIPKIGRFGGLEELPRRPQTERGDGTSFSDTLKDAIHTVDELQKESEAAQLSWARNEDVDLHEVLIKIEEAEVAFKTMMEVRNKLVEAYREVMRMGS